MAISRFIAAAVYTLNDTMSFPIGVPVAGFLTAFTGAERTGPKG